MLVPGLFGILRKTHRPSPDSVRAMTRRMGAVLLTEPGLVMAAAAHRPDGPALVTEPVEIPLAQYDRLIEPDFMVSVYNARTVPRLLLAVPGGDRRDVHELLGEALAAIEALASDAPAAGSVAG